jgi:uncharacterized membrane protein YfhO
MLEEGPSPDANGIPADGVDFRVPAFEASAIPVGEILDARRNGEDFDVRARVDRAGFLLLRMSYHPGWRAVVDGREVPTVPLLPSFVGVRLDPGDHEVRLRYRAAPSRAPLLAGGFLALALACVFGRRFTL